VHFQQAHLSVVTGVRLADGRNVVVKARPAPPASAVAALEPPPPWCYWDHHEDGPWPWPDDMDADLNARPGPAWLDDAAIRIRVRLARCAGPLVVGHCDWESQNIRWHGGRLHAVHDWDSVVSRPEAAIAGLAAAVFAAAGDPGEHATVAQGEQFLAAYERACGHPWTAGECEVAWAAGAWVTALNAKKDAVRDGQAARGLAAEIADRIYRAGA
jgi:Ser/Thr protein kinase RdoA (MazF antagonist)